MLVLVDGFEGEELVAVIFVLLAAGGDFGGQAIFEIADQGFEAIKDGDDFFLDGERGNGNSLPFIKCSANDNSYGRGSTPSEGAHLINLLADRDEVFPSYKANPIKSLTDRDEPCPYRGINYWLAETMLF